MGVNGSFTLVKFGGVPRLIKSSKILRHRVDISGNLKLIDLNKFPRF